MYNFCVKVCGFFRRIKNFSIVHSFAKHGKHIRIGKRCTFVGTKNISFGSNIILNQDILMISAKAKIILGDNILIGPNVSIITGNHRFDIVDKPMIQIDEEKEKLLENDQDIIFEGDNWVGCGAVILKGVTVGYGAIVGAGAVVAKNVPPYSVVAGNPAKVIKMRK